MLGRVADRDDAKEREAAAAAAAQRARELEQERQLVAKAQTGDRAAMGELFRRYGPGLYRSVLLPRLGSDAAAKDALSETYAKVVERIDRFTWQNVGFYPWLRTVALRVALDHLRAKKRLVLWEADDLQREVDASATATPLDQQLSDHRDREAARRKVEEALSRINPRYARAIRLRVLEDKPREEVAKTMEVTPATFDVLLHRALAALKKSLEAGVTAGAPAERAAKTNEEIDG
jgi:RNA polymerase sigma-70 factor (ECF subfamily)